MSPLSAGTIGQALSGGMALRRLRVNPRWINPATGNDANDGQSPATAWATVAPANTALAVANNGITHLRIDTSGAPLYLTASLVIPATARGITLEGATPGTKADIRAYKVLSNAAFTQPDAVTYPNVWQVSDSALHSVLWERGGTNAYDLIWYTHPTGANFAAVAATLNSTAGSFWTDGTTMYFRPLAGNNPVSDGKEYVRSRGIQTAAIDCGSAPGLVVRNLMVGGTCLARSTDNDPIGAYCINVTPGAGRSVVQNCLLYYGSKHALGLIEGTSNSGVLVQDVQAEQCTPYAGIGGQTLFVSYATTGTGMSHIYQRCSSVKNTGLVGSMAGTIVTTNTAMYSHNTGSGTQYASILLDNCSFPGQGISQGNLQWASGGYIIRNTRFGVGSMVDAVLEACHIDVSMVAPSATTSVVRLRNCKLVPTLTMNDGNNGFRVRGTLDIQNCTIDLRATPMYFKNAWLYRDAALTMTFKNNIILSTTNGGSRQAVLSGLLSTDTAVFDRNLYDEAGTTSTATAVVVRSYDGSTTKTLADWQALSQDLSSVAAAALLNADLTPTASSPARNLAVTTLTSDYAGDITPRVTSGAYEYRP